MRRGTTPTLNFQTPYAAELVASGYITFKQRGQIVLDVPISDSSVTVSDNQVSISLSQEDTLAMTTADTCKAQLRLMLQSGKAVASNIVDIPICAILKEGEI